MVSYYGFATSVLNSLITLICLNKKPIFNINLILRRIQLGLAAVTLQRKYKRNEINANEPKLQEKQFSFGFFIPNIEFFFNIAEPQYYFWKNN